MRWTQTQRRKNPLRNFATAHRRTAERPAGNTSGSLQPQARATKKFHVERFASRNSPTLATDMDRPQIMNSKEAPGWTTRESTWPAPRSNTSTTTSGRRRTQGRRRSGPQAERCQRHPSPCRAGPRSTRDHRGPRLWPQRPEGLLEIRPDLHRRQLRGPLLELD